MLEYLDEVLFVEFPERNQDTNGLQHNTQFLLDNITYHFPDYVCCMSRTFRRLKITLLVEDILRQSFKLLIDDDDSEVHVKFCSIKLDPPEAVHYAFMVKLPGRPVWSEDEALLGYRVYRNRVILYLPYLDLPWLDDEEIWFLCGRSMSELKKRTLFDYEMFIEDDFQSSSDESDGEAANNPDWATTDL